MAFVLILLAVFVKRSVSEFSGFIMTLIILKIRISVSFGGGYTVVQLLRYCARGFDSRWCHWIFSLT
jgi:hypothetical protein